MSSTEELEARLFRALDDLDIRRTVTDYAALVDARDWPRLLQVFDADAVVDYHNGRTVVTGAEAVVDYIRANTSHLAWQHHQVSPYGVDVSGDDATMLAYLVSYQQIEGEPAHVLTMAATYDVSLVRRKGEWRISRLIHTIRVATFLPVTPEPPNGSHVPPAVRH